MTSHSFVNHCQTFCSICFSFSFEPANSVILCIGTPTNWISQGNILEGIYIYFKTVHAFTYIVRQILKEQSAWNFWNMKDIYRWVEWSILHFAFHLHQQGRYSFASAVFLCSFSLADLHWDTVDYKTEVLFFPCFNCSNPKIKHYSRM